MIDFKNIHMGSLIEAKWKEQNISMERTCNFFKYNENEIRIMFQQQDLDTKELLMWSKLLEYDFFRIYSHHLILYSPPASRGYNTYSSKKKSSKLPEFRKNVYTQEIIDFFMELLNSREKTKSEIINEYKIPKTTLYKWISKYNKI